MTFKPWEHQKEAIEMAMQYPGGIGIFHDMGTGKTFTAIEIANRMGALRVLVLCPKSVIDVWPMEFAKHSRRFFE